MMRRHHLPALFGVAAVLQPLAATAQQSGEVEACPTIVQTARAVAIEGPVTSPDLETRYRRWATLSCPRGYEVLDARTCRNHHPEQSAIVLRWVIRCL